MWNDHPVCNSGDLQKWMDEECRLDEEYGKPIYQYNPEDDDGDLIGAMMGRNV